MRVQFNLIKASFVAWIFEYNITCSLFFPSTDSTLCWNLNAVKKKINKIKHFMIMLLNKFVLTLSRFDRISCLVKLPAHEKFILNRHTCSYSVQDNFLSNTITIFFWLWAGSNCKVVYYNVIYILFLKKLFLIYDP